LKVPDQMPLQFRAAAKVKDLGFCFLHTVFAELANARRYRLGDGLLVNGFGDGQERNLRL
jgi:hypothetical protein